MITHIIIPEASTPSSLASMETNSGEVESRNRQQMNDNFGLTPTAKAHHGTELLVAAIEPQFVSRAGFEPYEFVPISYRMKLVAGELYFIKVKINADEAVHLRVLKPLPWSIDQSVLEAWQTRMALEDPIVYFESDGSINSYKIDAVPQPKVSDNENVKMDVTPGYVAGLGAPLMPSLTTQDIVDQVRDDFTKQTIFKPLMFIAITERLQRATHGTHHFVKVKMSATSYVHLKIFMKNQSTPQLVSYRIGKMQDDKIEFF